MSNYRIVNGTFYDVTDRSNEICHYGVPGMRWGHRKRLPESQIAANVRNTRAEYKTANKAYGKAFNKAYDRSMAAYSPIKKHREANNARWEDAVNKAEVANKAQAKYKAAKKARKQAIKSTTKTVNANSSLGDKLLYSSATRKKAAKYVVDNNMSISEATKRAKSDAWRNTAVFVAGYAAVGVASLYASR
jgi:hypothetical protein